MSPERVAKLLVARFTGLEATRGSAAADHGSYPELPGLPWATQAAAALPFFKGVVFYNDGWQIMDLSGHIWQKAVSPIKEHEAFVVFDEARCRCVHNPLSLGYIQKAHSCKISQQCTSKLQK